MKDWNKTFFISAKATILFLYFAIQLSLCNFIRKISIKDELSIHSDIRVMEKVKNINYHDLERFHNLKQPFHDMFTSNLEVNFNIRKLQMNDSSKTLNETNNLNLLNNSVNNIAKLNSTEIEISSYSNQKTNKLSNGKLIAICTGVPIGCILIFLVILKFTCKKQIKPASEDTHLRTNQKSIELDLKHHESNLHHKEHSNIDESKISNKDKTQNYLMENDKDKIHLNNSSFHHQKSLKDSVIITIKINDDSQKTDEKCDKLRKMMIKRFSKYKLDNTANSINMSAVNIKSRNSTSLCNENNFSNNVMEMEQHFRVTESNVEPSEGLKITTIEKKQKDNTLHIYEMFKNLKKANLNENSFLFSIINKVSETNNL